MANTIVIKHSLTITKFPVYGQNPLITYDPNVTSNRKEFYVFAIFRDALAPNVLTLNIKSINFYTNILTTFSEGLKTLHKNVIVGEISGFQLWLSISDGIVSSASHAVKFSDISKYKNLAINMRDLVIESGDFMFENKRERCKPFEHIANIIEMYNVTICNTGNVTLSVRGCFNMSIENLTCSNITWNKQELFRFMGAVLNTNNVLIKNILVNNKMMKYNTSETKALFLINESVAKMQNILIKDSVTMSSIRINRFSSVIIVQNSVVQILNMKMVGNSFRNFVQASKSYLCLKNMILIENNVTDTLCRVEESNVTLHEIKLHRNKIGCLVSINLKSKVLITNNSLTGNKIFKNAYSISRSLMKLNNTNFCDNKIKRHIRDRSQSQIYIDHVTFSNNHVSFSFFNISKESKLELYNVEFLQNNSTRLLHLLSSYSIIQNNALLENLILEDVYYIKKSSTLQLNHVTFTRNKLTRLFSILSNSSAIIQNNTLLENAFVMAVYYIRKSSTLQLNHVIFTRNNLRRLFSISWNSSAIIQNNTLLENIISRTVYYVSESSTLQLNHATFTQNTLWWLVDIRWNSSAIIQNNTLLKNFILREVYYMRKSSTLHLNHVTFTRNKLMSSLFFLLLNSYTIIQNNALLENKFSEAVYNIQQRSAIKLMNVALIRNVLQSDLLYMLSSSAELINNSIIGNSLYQMFFAHSSDLEIDTIFIKNNTFSQLIKVVECIISIESVKIRGSNVRNGVIYVENSAGRMANTYIQNSDYFLTSAITTTWTYLRNKYFPFEITNTKIQWKNEVVSAKPIIQLSGNVSLSNVKLLVTSLFETEILKYSTKNITVFVNREPRTFPNIYIISSLFIGCSKASVTHIKRAGSFRCIPCARDTYTLNNESLNTSLSFQSISKYEKRNFTCIDCPVGANCKGFIKSKSNFYGYKTKEQKLKFLLCPRGFCCTGGQCNTINSCNKKRTGTLCGRCIESYVESFLSTDCVSLYSCQNFTTFWLLYYVYALILATFLYYMKDVISLIKTTAKSSSKILKSCKKEKENESEIDVIISIVGAEEDEKKTSNFTVSGIFTLIVSFYQIKQLMKVDVQHKNSTDFSFITLITDFLNLEIVAVTFSSYCPMSNLDAVSKIFIKTYLLSATLLVACLINYFMSEIFHYFRSSIGRLSSLKPSDRFGVCFIRLLMLSYKNIASASLLLLKCVEVADNHVLFIKGDMKCYQWWQILIAVFFFTWILFFPLSLKVSFNMFMKDKISLANFILCLIIPFAVVSNYRLNRSVVSVDLQKSRNTYKVK